MKVEILQTESLFLHCPLTSMHEADNMLLVSSYVIPTLSDWPIVHKKRIPFVSLTATNNPSIIFFKLKLSNPELLLLKAINASQMYS